MSVKSMRKWLVGGTATLAIILLVLVSVVAVLVNGKHAPEFAKKKWVGDKSATFEGMSMGSFAPVGTTGVGAEGFCGGMGSCPLMH